MSILQQANGLPEQGSHCLMRCLALLGLAIGFAGGSGFAQSPGFAPSQAVGPSPSAGAASAPAAVVELFTSQGCSSCPAADALLAQLASRGEVVALSLSVDYWDYLGWRDTLASSKFSEPTPRRAVTEQSIRRKSSSTVSPTSMVATKGKFCRPSIRPARSWRRSA